MTFDTFTVHEKQLAKVLSAKHMKKIEGKPDKIKLATSISKTINPK